MRLNPEQIEAIRQTVRTKIAPDASIWLFGSRANDALLGGDIDLFVETSSMLPNRAEAICHLYASLVFALGDRKIDILIKDMQTQEQPVFEKARREGVLL